jgi:hypothetical protein
MESPSLFEDSPYKQFRQFRKHMTTVIAIRCKDGIVLCSDSQVTRGNLKDTTTKIDEVMSNSLIASSGISNYIELFTQTVREILPLKLTLLRYYGALKECSDVYNKKIVDHIGTLPEGFLSENGLKVSDLYPDGIFVANYPSGKDMITRYPIVHVSPPLPPKFVGVPHRLAVGSGGEAATIFLKSIERIFWIIGLTWTDFSTTLAAQLCRILVRRIADIDPSSSGFLLYRITDKTQELYEWDIFSDMRPDEAHLTVLPRTFLKEISDIDPKKIEKLVNDYQILSLVKSLHPSLITTLLSSLTEEGKGDSVQ